MAGETGTPTEPSRGPRARIARVLPMAALLLGAALALIFLRDYLSFDALERHYEALLAWRDAHFLGSAAVFFLAYALAVAVSIPGAVWLTLIGGLLFGTVLGSVLVVGAATVGATALFLAARSSLGAALRARAGGWVQRLEDGFRDGEVSFLLMLRLIPAVPFWIANLAPAFLGARLWPFFWTTLVGILPGTFVYVSVGAGLGTELAEGRRPDLGVIFEPHVLGPLLGLAALSALPLILRKFGLRRMRG